MMEIDNRPHRLRFADAFNNANSADQEELTKRYTEYYDAHRDFQTNNSDLTMVNLIGKWARFTRQVWAVDDKAAKK